MIRVELYADPPQRDAPSIRVTMTRGDMLAGPGNGFAYQATVSQERPVRDYTPRVISYHAGASIPLESDFILWWK